MLSLEKRTPELPSEPVNDNRIARWTREGLLSVVALSGCAHAPDTQAARPDLYGECVDRKGELEDEKIELKDDNYELALNNAVLSVKLLYALEREYDRRLRGARDGLSIVGLLGDDLERAHKLDRIEQTVVEGDPKVGKLVHIRQVHSSPIEGQEDAYFEQIAAYQLRILKELLETKPSAIIPEGLRADKPKKGKKAKGSSIPKGATVVADRDGRETYLRGLTADQMKIFGKIKTPEDIDSLNGEDKKLLYQLMHVLGAANFYAFQRNKTSSDKVSLIPSGSHEVARKFMDVMDKITKKQGELDGLSAQIHLSEKEKKKKLKVLTELDDLLQELQKLAREREKELEEATMSHLKSYPGSTVVTVYGGAHNFCDDFDDNKPGQKPVVTEVVYPALGKAVDGEPMTIFRACDLNDTDNMPTGL